MSKSPTTIADEAELDRILSNIRNSNTNNNNTTNNTNTNADQQRIQTINIKYFSFIITLSDGALPTSAQLITRTP